MSFIVLTGHVVAGLRIALVLFAVMSLFATRVGVEMNGSLAWHRRRAWIMLSIAVVVYSPAHAAWALGHAIPLAISRILDGLTTLAACGAFIHLLAGHAIERGVSWHQARRGMVTNVGVVIAFVGAVCLTR